MIYTIADLIGQHGLELLINLVLIVIGLILLLWELFERYYKDLWRLGSDIWDRISSLSVIKHWREQHPRSWTFLGRRLSPHGYLGLHLTLGLLLTVLAVNLFAGIADVVIEDHSVTQFDQTLAVALHKNAIPGEVAFFNLITNFGGRIATFGLGFAVGIILLIRRHYVLLIGWIVALAGGGIINAILKAYFQRPRPEFDNPFITETNWSFPSGHAMGSVIIYGMLAYFLILLLNRYMGEIVMMGTVTLILLIGFSRLFLGVHYFSDVVAGYIAGAGWLAVTISGTEVARRRWQGEKSRTVSSPQTDEEKRERSISGSTGSKPQYS